MAEDRKCAWCGANFVLPRLGAPKKYCNVNCKQSAGRSRAGEAGRQKARKRSASWYAANQDYAKAKQREWNAQNAEQRKVRDAAYYRRNADRCRARQRQWLQTLKRESPDDYQRHIRDQCERARKRATEQAIALLVMPIEQQ